MPQSEQPHVSANSHLSSKWPMFLVASLTLGLAPFTPEPHIVEKFKWFIEGHAFKPIDYFDVLLHGSPWLLLILSLSLKLIALKSKISQSKIS